MTALAERCLTELTAVNGAYIAEMVAYALINNGIDGVKFNVPQSVRNELVESMREHSAESSDLNRRFNVCTAALDSMIYGKEYDADELPDSYKGYVPGEYDEDIELFDNIDIHKEVLSEACEMMGERYESYADPKKFAEFSGARAFREASLLMLFNTLRISLSAMCRSPRDLLTKMARHI